MVRSVPTFVDQKDRSGASFSPLFGTLGELCPCGCGGRTFRWAEGGSLAVCFQTHSGVRELIHRVPLVAAQKHLLQVFLNHTRDKRECWPSEERLRQCTGLKSRQTVSTHKKGLREAGILEWERPRQRGNHRSCLLYRLSWEALQELAVASLREPPGCSWPATPAAPQATQRAPLAQPRPCAPRTRAEVPRARADARRAQADAPRAEAPQATSPAEAPQAASPAEAPRAAPQTSAPASQAARGFEDIGGAERASALASQAAPWTPPVEPRSALPWPPATQQDATPTVAGALATVLARLAAARGLATAAPLSQTGPAQAAPPQASPAPAPLPPASLAARNDDLELVLDEVFSLPFSATQATPCLPPVVAEAATAALALSPEPMVAAPEPVAMKLKPTAVEPEPAVVEPAAFAAEAAAKPAAAEPSLPGEPAAAPVTDRSAAGRGTEVCPATAPLAPAASPPRPQPAGGAFVVPVALVWNLWRDAYQRTYGRPYVQAAADRGAAGEIAEACAAAVLHHERRANLAPDERQPQAQAYLRHVFEAFLRRAGRNGFLRERKHPLSQLPADLNALGEPWSGVRKAAVGPSAPLPLPPPLPREEQLARCRGVMQALDLARPSVRPRILKSG